MYSYDKYNINQILRYLPCNFSCWNRCTLKEIHHTYIIPLDIIFSLIIVITAVVLNFLLLLDKLTNLSVFFINLYIFVSHTSM